MYSNGTGNCNCCARHRTTLPRPFKVSTNITTSEYRISTISMINVYVTRSIQFRCRSLCIVVFSRSWNNFKYINLYLRKTPSWTDKIENRTVAGSNFRCIIYQCEVPWLYLDSLLYSVGGLRRRKETIKEVRLGQIT